MPRACPPPRVLSTLADPAMVDHHRTRPGSHATSADAAYRRALWIALVVNGALFATEITASWTSGSVALLADAIDFLGDSAGYGLSLAMLGMSMAARARSAVLKAACMAGFGIFVVGKALWNLRYGATPEPLTMGVVGFAALIGNLGVAMLLHRFRRGDADMRSVWITSRNDVLGNLAVLAAAAGVFGTSSAWPDLIVATVMGLLAITGAAAVMRKARIELRRGHGSRKGATR